MKLQQLRLVSATLAVSALAAGCIHTAAYFMPIVDAHNSTTVGAGSGTTIPVCSATSVKYDGNFCTADLPRAYHGYQHFEDDPYESSTFQCVDGDWVMTEEGSCGSGALDNQFGNAFNIVSASTITAYNGMALGLAIAEHTHQPDTGVVFDIAECVADDCNGTVGDVQETAQEAVDEALATVNDVAALAEDAIDMILPLVDCTLGNDLLCTGITPTGAVAGAQDELEQAVEQALETVAYAQEIVDNAGGDITETGESVIDLVNSEIDRAFTQLNGTLVLVFDQVNFLVETLPAETRETVGFIVDTANSEIAFLLGQGESAATFALSLVDTYAGFALETLELLRATAIEVVDSLPLHRAEDDYNTIVDQLFFAFDGLVASRLDESRAADRLVLVIRGDMEIVVRAAGGYAGAKQEGGLVDNDKVIDTTLAVTDATTKMAVNAGFALAGESGHDEIYQDLVCNRLNLCD